MLLHSIPPMLTSVAVALILLVQSNIALDKSWLSQVYDGSPANLRKVCGADGKVFIELYSSNSSSFEKHDGNRTFSAVPLRGGGASSSIGKPIEKPPTPPVTEEDKKIRKDWGGNCSEVHWLTCVNRSTFGNDIFDAETGIQLFKKMNCEQHTEDFPPLCLFSGWTVTRCHLLCMSNECNYRIKKSYDQFVEKEGYCMQ